MTADVACAVLAELGVLTTGQEQAGGSVCSSKADGPVGQDHALRLGVPLWAFDQPVHAIAQGAGPAKPLFDVLLHDPGPEGVLGHTRLIVFLGAQDSPTFRRFLDAPDALLLVLDPCKERIERLARAVPATRLVNRALLFLGRPETFDPPLSALLPAEIFQLGFPVFYGLPELLDKDPELAAEYVRLLEILFYRYRVYPVSGQANNRGLPLRPMTRGLFYDQQLHAYENTLDAALCPDIRPLRKAFPGETAILVAASPALPRHLDYLRRVRESAVLIAVNNALKPLLAAGIRPHFVVANDTSTLVAQSWAGLQPMGDVILVGHCLIDLAGDLFARKYLFGTYRPELFGTRPNLRLHGSVITTAFSLARHLGCARCILAGVELSSQDTQRLAYSRGSIHETGAAPGPAVSDLYSLKNALGVTCYTTPNFLDAALWLLDEIRQSGIPCVNLADTGLIHGPGIEHVPDCPVEPTGLLERRLQRLAAQRHAPRPLRPVLEAAAAEAGGWNGLATGLDGVLALHGPEFLSAAWAALQQFEGNNISYLVQRFGDFDNAAFHRAVFAPATEAEKAAGLREYLAQVRAMASGFARVLEGQHAALLALAARA